MALELAADIAPAGGQTFYLMEDIYLKGGLQIRDNVAARDAIAIGNLKLGAMVYTIAEKKIWLVSELVVPSRENPDAVESVTWEELAIGGGAGGPDAPVDGKIYGRQDGEWVEVSGAAGSLNTRMVGTHVVENLIPDGLAEFTMRLAVSCIVLKLDVSRPCRVRAFSTLSKDEPNPYEFIATSDHLADDGMMLMADGTKFRSRNFSIFSNMENPVGENIYFSIDAVDEAEGPVTLNVTYLPLELLPPVEEPTVPDTTEPPVTP